MSKCAIIENIKGKKTPPCRQDLVKGSCSVHCRAKLRGERAGRLCPNRHKKGRKGCRMHGGNAAVGIAAAKFKHGEYSRYLKVLSPKVAERYTAAQSNPNFLSLAPDIWMIQTRIEELVRRATESNESGEAWSQARQAFDEFMAAQESKNRAAGIAALTRLNQVISAGSGEYDAWNEVKDLWIKLQRMVESERRRALEYGEMLQAGVILNILRTTANLVREYVQDKAALDAISAGLGRITGGTIQTVATAGNGGASSEPDRTALVAASRK